MNKDEVFLAPEERTSDFEFNAEVAEVFDDMVLCSVPFSPERQGILRLVVMRVSFLERTLGHGLMFGAWSAAVRDIPAGGRVFGNQAQAIVGLGGKSV
jgi:hypothetical protein